MFADHFYTGVVIPTSVLLPIVPAVIVYRNLERPQKIIFFYLIFAGIVDGVAGWLSMHHMSNLWILHPYTAIETVLLLWFYHSIISDKLVRRVVAVLMVLFPLICIANMIWGQGLLRFNTYTRPLEALILIFTGIVYFFESSRAVYRTKPGMQKALSWMNAGLLIYFSSGFFYFIFSNYLKPGQAFSIFILIVHATFVLFMYLLFMIGFLRCRN